MAAIRSLILLCLFTSALAQVQTVGTATLTGSVQLMAGGKHSVTLAWDGMQGQYITFRVYRSTISGSGYQMIQSEMPGLRFTDVNVKNSTTYYYVITTYDSSTKTESAPSGQMVAVVPN